MLTFQVRRRLLAAAGGITLAAHVASMSAAGQDAEADAESRWISEQLIFRDEDDRSQSLNVLRGRVKGLWTTERDFTRDDDGTGRRGRGLKGAVKRVLEMANEGMDVPYMITYVAKNHYNIQCGAICVHTEK